MYQIYRLCEEGSYFADLDPGRLTRFVDSARVQNVLRQCTQTKPVSRLLRAYVVSCAVDLRTTQTLRQLCLAFHQASMLKISRNSAVARTR